jgi:MFS family permease
MDTVQSVASSRTGRWAKALGVPAVHGQGRILAAVVVDALGVGMFIPLSFLYFTLTTAVSATAIGAVISAATLLTLPAGFVAGTVADRWDPKILVVINNLVSAAGYTAFLFCRTWPQIFLAVLVVTLAERLYWSGWPPFLSRIARPDELDAWFAFTESIKSGCFGLGALLGGIALAIDGGSGPQVLVLLNVASYISSAWLLGRAKVAPQERPAPTLPPAGSEEPPASWRRVLRQRWIVVLALAQTALAFAWLLPSVVIPVYAVEILQLPSWMPSLVFAVNSVGILVAQTQVTARVRRLRRTRVLAAGAAVAAASIVLLALSGQLGRDAAAVLVAASSVTVTLAWMLTMPTGNALVAAGSAPDVRGRSLALLQVAGGLGLAAGPAVVGTLLDLSTTYLWIALAGLAVSGVAGFLVADRLVPAHALRPMQDSSNPPG